MLPPVLIRTRNVWHWAAFQRDAALLSALSNRCCYCFSVFWRRCKILGWQTQHCRKKPFDWIYSDPSLFGMLFEVKPFKSIPLIQFFFYFCLSAVSCHAQAAVWWTLPIVRAGKLIAQMLLHLSFRIPPVHCDWARLSSWPGSHRLIHTWNYFQVQLCTL